MTIHPVQRLYEKEPQNTIKVKTTKSKSDRLSICERWMIISGEVKILHEHDVSTKWLNVTEYELEFKEGAIIETTRVDIYDKVFKRKYTCKDGKLYYEII